MVSKFTQKDLDKLEGEQELRVYKYFEQKFGPYFGVPSLTERQEKDLLFGIEKASPMLWKVFQTWDAGLVRKSGVLVHVQKDEIKYFKSLAFFLEEHFPGKNTPVGRDAMIYKSFKTYTDLAVEAMELFADQFQRLGGFGGGSYEQLFSSVRLGLYSAVENCVLSRSGLNYPDPGKETSPRLTAVRSYLSNVYYLRVRFLVLDAFVRLDFFKKDVPGYQNKNQWKNFLDEVKKRLEEKFGVLNAEKIFFKIFSSFDPSPPKDQKEFNFLQEQILTWILKCAVKPGEVNDEPINLEEIPQADNFQRDYAKEQAERKAKEEAEEKQRKAQEERERAENPDWSNIHKDFKRNPNLAEEWTKRGFSYPQVKEWIDIGFLPSEYEGAEWLRDVKGWTAEKAMNEGNWEELKEEFQAYKDSKTNNNDEKDSNDEPKPTEPTQDEKKNSRPPSRSSSRSSSPSRQAAKDKLAGKEVPPPAHTEFDSTTFNDALNEMMGDFATDSKEAGNDTPYTPAPGLGMPITSITKEEAEKLPWLAMGFGLKGKFIKPRWKVFDPANFAAFVHGSDSVNTLCLQLYSVRAWSDFSNVFHQFFWNKGDENVKGFARLQKNEDPAREEEIGKEKGWLLIPGRRNEDIRADKLGWDTWPFDRNHRVDFGVPGVRQKSYRFTRWLRSQNNAYDLDDSSHLIGLMRDKNIITQEGTECGGRDMMWGTAPHESVLWITNQMKFDFENNQDWIGDDITTINPNNGFTHYLIFSDMNYLSQHDFGLPRNFRKNLVGFVSSLNQFYEGTTTLCIGPDVLNLKNLNPPRWKEPLRPVKPEHVDPAKKEVKDQDLKDMGITRDDFDTLNAPFQDPAKIANIIKKIANSSKPEKVAEMLNKLFEHLPEETREMLFNQMVDNNPVFSEEEKEKLKEAYKKAKTAEEKKKVWEHLTSHQAAREAHKKKTEEEKDKIFEEQINKNPAYGPPGEDTQERRNKFTEYENASPKKKEKMQEKENKKFTTGTNAEKWGEFWQAAANKFAGADDNLNCEGDDANQQFSWTDSFKSVHKLKDIFTLMPENMNEGMKSNKPYWQVIWSNPLVYIFLFIGAVMAVLAMSIKKNK